MQNRKRPLSSLWMVLGGVLAAFGGIPLLTGTANDRSGGSTRAIAKLLVGAVIIAYAVWLRQREAQLFARGSMASNEEP